MAIITTVPASTSVFAIHGFMARHRPFHTALRRHQRAFVRLTRSEGGQPSGNVKLAPIPVLSYGRRRLSRPMRLEEGMDLAHRQGNPLFGLFPGEDAHFGLW